MEAMLFNGALLRYGRMSAEVIRVSAMWQKGYKQKDGRRFPGRLSDFELSGRRVFERCLKRAFQPGEKIYEVIVL